MTTINEIADAAFENAKAKGFHDNRFEQSNEDFMIRGVALIHEEASELFSAVRARTHFTPCDKAAKMQELGLMPLNCAEEEYADIVIRVLDQCRRLNIDIQTAIQVKHAYNCTRPLMHGGKAL